jgi:pimeloyl-ACP methyl ester carboxylesterase
MKRELYLLSGLGVDNRVFRDLDFRDYEPHYVKWIDPLKGEPIKEYAARLISSLNLNHNPTLLGVSFGGIMAIEMAKLIPTEKVVIISSAKTRHQMPGSPLGRKLRLHTILPTRFMLTPNQLLYWMFGVHTKPERDLLREILADTDEKFFRWAINQILNWNNEFIPANTTSIHGSKDRLIPNGDADYIVDGGGHLMVLTKAPEINAILSRVL